MKKLSRRALGLLLSVLMLASLFPVSAFAEEAAGDEHVQPLVGAVETETVMPAAEAAQPEPAEELKADYTYINPLYQGLISEDQLRKPEEGSDSQTYSLEARAEYTSDEALVVQQLRSELKQRSETIQFYYIMECSGDGEIAQEEFKQQGRSFWEQALAHTGAATEGDYLAYQYGGYNGTMSAHKSDGLYYVTYNYTVTYYTTVEQESEMDTAAASVIAALALDGKSDYEKLAAIYGYICDNVTYDYANLEDSTYLLKYTAYAALINKTAVCQGYAVLLYRLALMAGVDARVIAGIGGGGNHAWNIARIGSLYYDLDSTWDAGKSSSSYNYFLRCEANFTNHTRNEEFTTAEFNSAYPMADADYVPGSESEETVSGTCGENLTWVLEGGTLTVSGTGAMDEYSVGEAPWYAHREEIRKLVIDSGVTTISGFVFDSCTSLTEVYLPLSLEKIGMNAFQNCGPVDLYYAGDLEGWLGLTVSWNALTYGGFNLFLDGVLLTELNVPADVTTIGSFAFAGCLSLTGVTMAEGVTGVADWAFSHCDNLTDISFATSIETIGNWAFCDCPSLVNVSLPANAAYGDGVFEECSGLTSISLPENMTSITDSMFMDCTSLAEITIPASVTAIESYAFYNCGVLTDVYYGGSEARWSRISVGENNDPLLSATIHYNEEEGVLTPDENGNYHITSFAELKALSAMTFEDAVWVYYEESEAFVFEEDLTLPEKVHFIAYADLSIPAGVTVTANCDEIYCDTLSVEGTLISYAPISLNNIAVSGSVQMYAYFGMPSTGTISGEENISFYDNEMYDAGFCVRYEIQSYEELKNLIQESYANKPNWDYDIHLSGSDTISIDESFVLGDNVILRIFCPVIIEENVQLEVDNYMQVSAEMTVNGTLKNMESINLFSVSGVHNNVRIVLNETGTYSGTGTIHGLFINYETNPAIEDLLSGFDLTQFDIEDNADGSWQIVPKTTSGGLTPDENGNYHITSFAELKALSAMTFENTVWIYYEGNEALVFEEDLTLPESIMLVSAADVRIPSGVTVTMQCDFSGWGRTLYVEGTLIAYASIGVQDINVSGRLESHSSISLTSNSVITGEENISFVQNEANGISGFSISYNVDSYEGLKEAVQEANTNKPNRSYSIHLRSESTVTIEEELSLGENTELNVNCPLVIAESGKLSIQGWMYVYTPVTVNGSLDNGNRIIIHHSVSPAASITLGETGSYSGTGIIAIFTQTLTSPEEALPGFDLTDFDVVSNGSGWSIYYAAEMEKLATPVDLLYGYRYNFTYDENGEVSGYETVEAPGMLSWRVDGLTQEQFVIEIYKDDGETPIASALWFFGDFYSGNRIYSIDEFIRMDPESGEYYFTVKSNGDYTKYSSSDVAVSETWTYVKPELSLGDCTRPVVDGQNVSFLLPEDLTYVGGSEVEIYYSATPDMSEGICCGASWFLDNHALSQREAASYIYDDAIQSNGSGYYAVRVRALSWDINSACNGSWSELSEPCYIGDTVGEVDSILQDIEDGTVEPTPENVRGLVQQNDTEDLKKAMLADGDDNGVNSSLQALEEYTGGTVVQVTDSMAGRFSQEQVSVIGASLNDVQNGEKPVKLIVDQAKEDDVIPEVFDNTVAVRFSLELENVDSTQLDVPVKITLPVPDGINPEFLVILHYHVTGEEPEQIWPYVFQQDGQYYASFVLTSFSDFVMTMPAEQGTECQHEWDDGKVTVEPGCETSGIRTYTCKLCGETRTEGITAKGHSQDDGKITTEPGCETEGVKTYSCTVCGKELKTEAIAAKGHSQDDGKITTEPGCETEGVKTYSCTVCGKELKTEPVPAAGHSWDEGKITTLPTAAKEGEKVYTCTVCGETRTEVIPALKVDGELTLSTTLSKDLSLMRVELKNLGVYVDGVKIAVWSTRQGKSTLKEFEAENKDGVWTVNVPLCAFDLCTADVFQVEAYGVKAAKRELLAQTKVDIVAAPTHVYSSESDATCNSCGRVRKTDLSGVKTTPMYRLYNPFTGEHFYTGSTEERDTLSAIGWKYEGVAWNAPVSGGTPVHRVCNPNSGDHHFTTSMSEVLMLLNAGWQYENICWNSAFSDAIPQYRMWNKNADLGSHHYTSSTEERQILVDAGWIYEGIGWYGMKN